ncbi:MFS transporter [Undibacterium parvum]|uniref:MFS transporter n=1 Tax=Undibacterium parvum TaxID=401471 RepID=A0A3Q9BS57_9BURK|nr:MFS transporter [Undibacterium parvum]AZP13296.1 MFS transporter [Undibacterium parvum]
MTTENTAPRHPMRWVPTLYLAEGLPFYAVALVASLMYKSMGVANDEIAYWTGLITFAWVFKSLWSPFLEAASSKKFLVVMFQLIGGVCLGLVALSLQLPMYFAISIALLGLVAIAAATHDIAADGLYIASLSNKQQAAYAGWQGAFFNAGKFISLGGLVVLAGHLEKSMPPAQAWAVIFGILGSMMIALALYHSWALPGTKNTNTDASMRSVFLTLKDVIITFFQKPGIWLAILFILLFRVGEGQIQTIGPLFLREAKNLGGLGLSTAEVGIVYGTAGTIAFLGGSILGGYFASWLGLKRALPWLILAMNVPNLVFFFLSTSLPENLAIVATALSFEMFGYGFGFVGLILFMMQVIAVGKYQTAHYALATGVMQLGLVVPKMVSGSIQMSLGYKNFFIWVLISAIPVLLMSRLLVIKTPVKTAPAVSGNTAEA